MRGSSDEPPDAHGGEARAAPEPQGHLLGVPFDFRPPTLERVRARWWNAEDDRLFTPHVFGWGYGLNLYWLAHPGDYVNRRTGRGRA